MLDAKISVHRNSSSSKSVCLKIMTEIIEVLAMQQPRLSEYVAPAPADTFAAPATVIQEQNAEGVKVIPQGNFLERRADAPSSKRVEEVMSASQVSLKFEDFAESPV